MSKYQSLGDLSQAHTLPNSTAIVISIDSHGNPTVVSAAQHRRITQQLTRLLQQHLPLLPPPAPLQQASLTVAVLWQPNDNAFVPTVLATLTSLHIAFCPFSVQEESALWSHMSHMHGVITFQNLESSNPAWSSLPCAGEVPTGQENCTIHFHTNPTFCRPLAPSGLADNFAYHIRTSGSTGQPKWVSVPHSCIVPNIVDLANRCTWCPTEDCILSVAPLTFDPAIVDMFLALHCRVPLLFLPTQWSWLSSGGDNRWIHLVEQYGVSYLQCTPSFLLRLGEATVRRLLLQPSLKYLLLGGEPPPCVERLRGATGLQPNDTGRRTHLWVIYGLTELSSWASVGELENLSTFPFAPSLGQPMLDTRWHCQPDSELTEQYRSAMSGFSTSGQSEGEAFVGELHIARSNGCSSCVINGVIGVRNGSEDLATGDVVLCWRPAATGVEKMYFLGRRDRMIKRRGVRVYLQLLESAVLNCPEVGRVQHCLAEWLPGFDLVSESLQHRLWLTVQLEAVTAAGTVQEKKEEQVVEEAVLTRLIRQQLGDAYLPDDIIIVHTGKQEKSPASLQLSENGKLLKTPHLTAAVSAASLVRPLWLASTGNPPSLGGRANFLQGGGSSLGAVAMCNRLLRHYAPNHMPPFTSLLRLLLDSDFDSVCSFLDNHANNSNAASDGDNSSKANSTQPPSLDLLRLHWRVDMQKCIDSTVCVIIAQPQRALVSSHAGIVRCVDLASGSIAWSRTLPQRLDASGAVSPCQQYCLLPCRNARVYALTVHSGALHCEFQTRDFVKGAPVFAPHQPTQAYFGCYDRHLYAVDLQQKCVLWTLEVDGSGIAAALVWNPLQSNALLCGTLAGNVWQVDSRTAAGKEQEGSRRFPSCDAAAILATPACCKAAGTMVVGTVKGQLFVFSLRHTTLLGCFHLPENSPIFAPICAFQKGFFLVGCHNGKIYAVPTCHPAKEEEEEQEGQQWPIVVVVEGSSAFTGSVAVHAPVGAADDSLWLYACESNGSLWKIAFPFDKSKNAVCFKFDREVFSSPVIVQNVGDQPPLLCIGCRDNYCYALYL